MMGRLHWLRLEEGCCACAQCVGAVLLSLGEIWWWRGEALCALHEQRDLTSSTLLPGASCSAMGCSEAPG